MGVCGTSFATGWRPLSERSREVAFRERLFLTQTSDIAGTGRRPPFRVCDLERASMTLRALRRGTLQRSAMRNA